MLQEGNPNKLTVYATISIRNGITYYIEIPRNKMLTHVIQDNAIRVHVTQIAIPSKTIEIIWYKDNSSVLSFIFSGLLWEGKR